MDVQEKYAKCIREAFPQIEVRDIQVISGQGQYNDILAVNDEYIFRFPKAGSDIDLFKREAAVLKALKGRLPVPIPDLEYASLDHNGNGDVFYGYRKLPGVPLNAPTVRKEEPQVAFQRTVSQMVEFVKALHALAPDSLGVDLPRRETRADVGQLHTDIREKLYSFMNQEATGWVDRQFEDFLSRPENFEYHPVLRHGDLGASNILIDPASGKVTGILDFSELAIGDPAVDVASLGSISEPFFSYLFKVAPEMIRPLMERAYFYKSTFALQEALGNLKTGDQDAFKRSIAPYRSLSQRAADQPAGGNA